jgi:predicted enzyme related to lactoylglutathione lyase
MSDAANRANHQSPKPNTLAHFAIEADDLDRAATFYTKVFGWKFEAWGPPDFFMIATADGGQPGCFGSLQKRHHPKGTGINGFECTIAVTDVDATAKAVKDAGGTIEMPRMTIGTVGHLIKFRDPEGNLVGAMQYDYRAP